MSVVFVSRVFRPGLLGAPASALVALLACLPPAAAAPAPMVVAADGVLCDLTRTLAAEQVRVLCLIPAGADPHQAVLAPGIARPWPRPSWCWSMAMDLPLPCNG